MTLKFSYNWNRKLNCKAFTTIRLHNPGKYAVGHSYEIFLKEKYHCHAKCIELKVFKMKDLNNYMAYLDTGYNKETTLEIVKKMYPKINVEEAYFDFILLEAMPAAGAQK